MFEIQHPNPCCHVFFVLAIIFLPSLWLFMLKVLYLENSFYGIVGKENVKLGRGVNIKHLSQLHSFSLCCRGLLSYYWVISAISCYFISANRVIPTVDFEQLFLGMLPSFPLDSYPENCILLFEIPNSIIKVFYYICLEGVILFWVLSISLYMTPSIITIISIFCEIKITPLIEAVTASMISLEYIIRW